MKTVIHVNRFTVDRNNKLKLDDAPLIARTYKGAVRGRRIKINGPCEVVYMPEGHPLACGARVWIETKAEVEVKDGRK